MPVKSRRRGKHLNDQPSGNGFSYMSAPSDLGQTLDNGEGFHGGGLDGVVLAAPMTCKHGLGVRLAVQRGRA